MPTATDELRDKMHALFGNRIDESGPQKFLQERGFMLSPVTWSWRKPKRSHRVTDDERDCIEFLVQGWDFGGLDD